MVSSAEVRNRNNLRILSKQLENRCSNNLKRHNEGPVEHNYTNKCVGFLCWLRNWPVEDYRNLLLLWMSSIIFANHPTVAIPGIPIAHLVLEIVKPAIQVSYMKRLKIWTCSKMNLLNLGLWEAHGYRKDGWIHLLFSSVLWEKPHYCQIPHEVHTFLNDVGLKGPKIDMAMLRSPLVSAVSSLDNTSSLIWLNQE